jgi:hypothetical protein
MPTLKHSYIILLFVSVLITGMSFPLIANPVLINEFMSSNNETITDEDGDYSDWIELYISDRRLMTLEGFGLSDEFDNPFKWTFPDIRPPVNGIILVFASGKNRSPRFGELHTNFRIDANGERLILTSPDRRRYDLVQPVFLEEDISYGRIPDGFEEWYYIDNPTPGRSNGNQPPRAHAPPPQLSHHSGIYDNSINLEITCTNPSVTIRYTLDGSTPVDTSLIYTEALQIDSVTIVRATSFLGRLLPSEPVTGSYIVGYETPLPIISIVTEPRNLWDWETGIYMMGPNASEEWPHMGANFWRDVEISTLFEFFEPDRNGNFSINAGLKIHGGISRAYAQRNLRITARDEYGNDRLNYQFFPDIPINSFKAIILRNSGNDWGNSNLRDGFMSRLMNGLGVDKAAYRPAVTFINGQYWGIYNVREWLEENHIANHHQLDKDSIDVMEGHHFHAIIAKAGDNQAWLELLDILEADNDMNDDAVYDSVASYVDIENFIRYMASEIYFANPDWIVHNIRWWRPKREGGKFKWIIYDLDQCFGYTWRYDYNALTRAVDEEWEEHTLLFRRLLEKNHFREMFITRTCDLMNTYYKQERSTALARVLKERIAPEMPAHIARWFPDLDWNRYFNLIYSFARERKSYVIEQLKNEFNLGQTIELNIELAEPPAGRVKINEFFIEDFPFQGDYFPNMPLTLTVEPLTGYQFSGWSGDVNSQSEAIIIEPDEDIFIEAAFESQNELDFGVVITEINYNSSDDFNPGDWIELYMLYGDHDLSGWSVRDERNDQQFILPGGVRLSTGDYLIIAESIETFSECFAGFDNVIGNLGFGLSADGDQVRLFNADGRLIDSVAYDDDPPWLSHADGYGRTLQLVDPAYANEYAHNWSVSLSQHGDPGKRNHPVKVEENKITAEIPEEFGFINAYPNPFNNSTEITYNLTDNGQVMIRIFDITGRNVCTLQKADLTCGRYHINWNTNGKASGIYFIRIECNNKVDVMKLICLK